MCRSAARTFSACRFLAVALSLWSLLSSLKLKAPSTNAAAHATAGQVVVYHGRIATTYYFSTSGGRTENIENVFYGSAHVDSTPEQFQAYRERALHLLCLAGLSGFPQITLPIGSVAGAPFGLSLLGLAYAALIPFSWFAYRRQAARDREAATGDVVALRAVDAGSPPSD